VFRHDVEHDLDAKSPVWRDRVERCSKTVAILSCTMLDLPRCHAESDAKAIDKLLQHGL
jgi:hypothetical protein